MGMMAPDDLHRDGPTYHIAICRVCGDPWPCSIRAEYDNMAFTSLAVAAGRATLVSEHGCTYWKDDSGHSLPMDHPAAEAAMLEAGWHRIENGWSR